MKHFLSFKATVLLLAIVGAVYLDGCVNVNNTDIQPVDYRSPVKFVNLANTGSTMSVVVDDNTQASVNFQAASQYLSLPSGGRMFIFTYGANKDTLRKALNHDTKYTIFSVQEPANRDTVRTYLLVNERSTLTGTAPFTPQSQLVRFMNLSSDTAATLLGGVTFHLIAGTHDTSTSAIKFSSVSAYYAAATSSAPKYIAVGAKGDTLLSTTATAVGSGDGRYSVVLYGSKTGGNLQIKVFQED